MKKLLLRWAINYLIKCLKKDKDLWQVYQASIAMVIYDEMFRYFSEVLRHYSVKKNKDQFGEPLNELLARSNKCANDFLNLWTKK